MILASNSPKLWEPSGHTPGAGVAEGCHVRLSNRPKYDAEKMVDNQARWLARAAVGASDDSIGLEEQYTNMNMCT